jgi:hypothetical protein
MTFSGRSGGCPTQELEHVKQKGDHRQNGASCHPLHLLAHDGDPGAAIAVPQDRRGSDKVCGQEGHIQAVKVPAQRFAGGGKLHHADAQRQEQSAGHIHRHQQPGALADELPMLGEGQRKVQEKRRLQQPCNYVPPENDLVKGVPLADVMEGIKNKRNQAKNIKMHGLGRSPPPQQYVKPNQQINQRDQPQSVVQGLIRRLRNEWNIHLHAIAHYGVYSLGVDTAHPIELPRAVSTVAYVRT